MPTSVAPRSRRRRTSSFEVPEGKLFTLLGPRGCGKTTTLRSIAGLERPTAGEIEVGGRVVYSSAKRIFVAPNKRNFGMVFQSYAIWPHMNVFQNAAFPLEVRRLPRKEIREQGDARARRRRSSTSWSIATRPSSPAASSSAWRWRARW